MDEPMVPPPMSARRSDSGALAIASFVLGLIAFITGFFLIGGLIGLVGLILGIIHLRRGSQRRAFAGWGIGLSAVGMAATLAVVMMYWLFVRLIIRDFATTRSDFEPSSWVGKPAPEMILTTIDGRVVRTADWKGKAVVVDMWASWHPACVEAIPDFNRLVDEATTQSVQVLAVTFEDASDLGVYATNTAIRFPIVATTNLPSPFGDVDSIPTTFFIDAEGVIREVRSGYEGYETLKQSALGGPVTDAAVKEEESRP